MPRMMAELIEAVAVAALTTLQAKAAAGYDWFLPGNYCTCSGLDGTGDILQIDPSTPDLAVLGLAKRANSDWNRTDQPAYLFSGADYTGCTALSRAGSKGNFFITYREFFESVRLGGPGGWSCGKPPGEDAPTSVK